MYLVVKDTPIIGNLWRKFDLVLCKVINMNRDIVGKLLDIRKSYPDVYIITGNMVVLFTSDEVVYVYTKDRLIEITRGTSRTFTTNFILDYSYKINLDQIGYTILDGLDMINEQLYVADPHTLMSEYWKLI